ncbi:MAG: DNA polymerase III subunit alpha [Lachnospiraceae bacterium]|nr:DNA polymerase III subunit alpha [Lachnospiraceae bacterium]
MAFVHLHTHTEYSLLDGMNRIEDYVARAKELGMTAAAITDHGVMYGVLKFYKAAKAAGIHPVLGCEVYVAPGSRFEKSSAKGDVRYYHLVLLAETNQGYGNLLKIVSKGYTEGFYFKPRVDLEVLREYHEGIICLSACLAGEVPQAILSGDMEHARAVAKEYREIFGPRNYFLEMQDHGMADQRTVNMGLMQISKELGIPLVATNDCHYTYREDADAHDILLCLQTNRTLNDPDRMTYYDGQFYVKSEEEMRQRFAYVPEAIENTQKIADRCQVDIEFGVTKIPVYEVPKGYDAWSYLNDLCTKGLEKRYGRDDLPAGDGRTLRERLDYELGVIRQMGYVEYFLIVWDFINYAKEHGILVGPGRGSAAGSIVSYCLEITNIDPIRYQLLFERFLNPERVSMPDIDVDFCTDRRREVIEYVTEKYGKDRVVQITTMGTLGAKGVVRDVARVMDLPYSFGDAISKKIPRELDITLKKALEMNPELKSLYDEDEQVRSVIDMSMRLEGLPRNTGTHAAGVVICQKAAEEYVPLAIGTEGGAVAQFDKDELESLGLLKMDFLGLTTLDVIGNAEGFIRKETGQTVDSAHVEMNDPKVFAALSTGHTEGVFQLESAGMRSFMKELQPENLEDVIAGISLYRPGPMSFIPKYIEGKNNRQSITYDCPQLEPILAPTYGCIVYQEQVMQIVRELGGYSMGRSDLVRRAMSKKKQSVMEIEREIFLHGNQAEIEEAEREGRTPPAPVPGCVARGISEQIGNKIYDEMMDFAKYAFNKSHAASYAVVAYQTAYLKLYYPVEFMASLMTSVIDNLRKVSEYIYTCRSMGIELVPPSVNAGEIGFTPANGKISYALTAIKGVGVPVIAALVAERELHGPYRSLRDFLERVQDKEMNRRAVEALIKAGALDCLGCTRQQSMRDSQLILDDLQRERKTQISGQMTFDDFFGEDTPSGSESGLSPLPEYDREQLLAMEKEVLGLYVSGHPLDRYRSRMEEIVTATSADFALDEEKGQANIEDESFVIFGGMISDKNVKYTKTNKVMCFLTVEDLMGPVEVIVFPQSYEKYGPILQEEAKVFIRGRVSVEEDKDAKLLLDEVVTFTDAEGKTAAQLFRSTGRFGNRGGYAGGRSWGNARGQYNTSSSYNTGSGYAEDGQSRKQTASGDPARAITIPEHGLFVQFPDPETYRAREKELLDLLADSDGDGDVVIFIRSTKSVRVLPPNRRVALGQELLDRLIPVFGEENVKIR